MASSKKKVTPAEDRPMTLDEFAAYADENLGEPIIRYSPIRAENLDDFRTMLAGAVRDFSIGRRHWRLSMTLPNDSIGVLWLNEPNTKPGEYQIRGVLSPAEFVLQSWSSEVSSGGAQVQVRFALGRSSDVFRAVDGAEPPTLDFGRYDFMWIRHEATHHHNGSPVVRGIRDTSLPLGRIRAEAIGMAGVTGIERVTKPGHRYGTTQKPVAYNALTGDEKNRLDPNWKRPSAKDPGFLLEVARFWVAEGGIEAEGKWGKAAPIYKSIEEKFGTTYGNAKQWISTARKQGLIEQVIREQKKGKMA